MTREAQRIAIAQAEGFRRIGMVEGSTRLMGDLPPCRGWIEIPDYLNDLNAMREAIMAQTSEVRMKINGALMEPFKDAPFCLDKTINATAAQRAEAFLRCLNLWQDERPSHREVP